jgi:hypothetical protein
MPLDQVWSRIRDGHIASRHEDGFTFVDMAPFGPHLQRPGTPRHLRPQTYTPAAPSAHPSTDDAPLSPEEMNSLIRDPQSPIEQAPEELLEDETASSELGDWRAARRKASRLRVPPPRRAPVH